MRYVLLLFVLAACDSPRYTYGDAVEELGTIYCTALSEGCGWEVDVPLCVEHTVFHLCLVEGTCANAVDKGQAEAVLSACEVAMANYPCAYLGLGFVPPECGAVFDLKGEP